MIELSIDQTIGLLRLASLGKLIGGLIHNINGPMQNLGLDIDMSNYLMQKDSDLDEKLFSDIKKRLQRMEEEFNRINQRIKDIAIRADVNNEYSALLSFNDFIQREMEFYQANLYFKHNVEVALELPDDPPMVRELPENSALALGWLISSLIEELENQEGKRLKIQSIRTGDGLELTIRAEKILLSDRFDLIFQAPVTVDPSETDDIALRIVKMIFESGGILLKDSSSDAGSCVVNLRIPVHT